MPPCAVGGLDIYDHLKTFCAFVGSTRSGHSLVGALIDAHRHAVIAHELDIFGPKGDRGRLRYADRDALFEAIIESSAEQARTGRTGARKSAEGARYLTSYEIPGQHQGRFDDLLVIGTKTGNRTVDAMRANPDVLDELRAQTGLELKLLHVVRNPFDNIAAIAPVPPERVKMRTAAIERYFRWARGVKAARERGDEILDVHLEDLIHRPAAEMTRICEFLGLEADPGYLEGCAAIFFARPNERRRSRGWTPQELTLIGDQMAQLPWLERYEGSEVDEIAAPAAGPRPPNRYRARDADGSLESEIRAFWPAQLRARLRALLSAAQPDPGEWLSPSPGLIRGRVDGELVVAVTGHKDIDPVRQVTGVMEALHWRHESHPESPIRYLVGSGRHTPYALQGLAVLHSLLAGKVEVRIDVDDQPAELALPDFSRLDDGWSRPLGVRDLMLADRPRLVRRLEQLVDRRAFRWQLSPSTPFWSGRLGGLRVCKVALHARSGVASLQTEGDEAEATAARDSFRRLAGGDEVVFDERGVDDVAALVRGLADERPWIGDPDQHLISSILCGATEIQAPHGARLHPALAVAGMPVAWWPDDPESRQADLLLHDGPTPWLVHVVVSTDGWADHRHAIALAALSSHFVHAGDTLHPWLRERTPALDPGLCQAAVVFPVPRGSRASQELAEVKHLAALLGVHALELADVSMPAPVTA